jgi:Ca2+-transporting ATPase
MGSRALRVLGGARRIFFALPEAVSSENCERELTFLGLVGMTEPVRPVAINAISICRRAGIRPIMITGDHKNTAAAIAQELEILSPDELAITGEALSQMSEKEFEQKVAQISVYARVQPEHKVRIVNAWKKRGDITAMRGTASTTHPPSRLRTSASAWASPEPMSQKCC